MDYSSIGFLNPSEPAGTSHKHCLTQLSFQAGLTEKMTSFTVGWSVNNMRPKFSCDVQGFEIPGARVGLGREQHDVVDHIQLQDNSSASSEQTALNENPGTRKRKACKDMTNTSPVKKSKGDENTAKRSRTDTASKELSEHSGNLSPKDSVEESYTKQQRQPPKDYIHVRARRGQATDSHSLAERVRREKISERMKFLQALVPGCSKVTGKAVMLDEIINYVQSLQRQIEFLSMKLAAVDPRNMENLLNKELATRSPETTLLGPDSLASYRDYPLHMQIQPQINDHCNMDLRILCEHACLGRSANVPVQQLPPQMAYSENFVGSLLPQTLAGVCDGDLQTVVQMGNSKNGKDAFGQGRSFISPGLSKMEY